LARLFVLGSGFSQYARLPLGRELFAQVVAAAKTTVLYENILKPDIDRFRSFKKRTQGVASERQEIDAEEFTSFLDVEHFLRLKGSDVYGEEGDRSQQLIKNLIAKTLFIGQQRMRPEQWTPYTEFASRLQPQDVVITFNYDTILETSLERTRVPYRLVPQRYEDIKPGYGTVASPETEVVVLKVHGSIDWFDRAPWEDARKYFAQFPVPIRDRHPIFGRPDRFDPTPITHEPYFPDSELHRIRRIRNIGDYLSEGDSVTVAPLILAPSYNKLLYANPLKEFWWGMDSAGSLMESMAIVGFSLPPHDQYAVQAIYAAVRNFQHFDTGDLVKKHPLRFVDFCQSPVDRERFVERYRFVDWDRTEMDERGFRPDAVPFLFGEGETPSSSQQ